MGHIWKGNANPSATSHVECHISMLTCTEHLYNTLPTCHRDLTIFAYKCRASLDGGKRRESKKKHRSEMSCDVDSYMVLKGCVWFMPRVALPKDWIAKILVDVLLAYKLASIG
jgi:hypothetical protein